MIFLFLFFYDIWNKKQNKLLCIIMLLYYYVSHAFALMLIPTVFCYWIYKLWCSEKSICIDFGCVFIRSLSLSVSGPYPLAGVPSVVWRGMERGGGESPRLRESPERRGSSSPDIGCPPPKMGRLELNGSPTGPRSRHNGAPQRPLSGKTFTIFSKKKKVIWYNRNLLYHITFFLVK